jgi:hypothetical protein
MKVVSVCGGVCATKLGFRNGQQQPVTTGKRDTRMSMPALQNSMRATRKYAGAVMVSRTGRTKKIGEIQKLT